MPLLGVVPSRSIWPPPVTVMLPFGFAPRVPLKTTFAPATTRLPFWRSWFPGPITQSPHGPRADPVSPTTATAWTLTFWLPNTPPSGVWTGRNGTSTRTCDGDALELNEMHWVSPVAT